MVIGDRKAKGLPFRMSEFYGAGEKGHVEGSLQSPSLRNLLEPDAS